MRTTKEVLRLGTRRSPLALAQTQSVINELSSKQAGFSFKVIPIQTEGDTGKSHANNAQGNKSAFTTTIENQLLAGEIDAAVHSLKDLPEHDTTGLKIGAIPKRIDARDVFVSEIVDKISDLPPQAVIGTSSIRRKAQLKARNPNIRVKEIRGNVETRLRKIGSGYDGVILAAAGLIRLKLQENVKEYLSFDDMLPPSGQGALAVQIRNDDGKVEMIVRSIENSNDRMATSAERSFTRRLGGDCNIPIAAHATIRDDTLTLDGLIASREGSEIIRDRITGRASDFLNLGIVLAESLLKSGGDRLLEVPLN